MYRTCLMRLLCIVTTIGVSWIITCRISAETPSLETIAQGWRTLESYGKNLHVVVQVFQDPKNIDRSEGDRVAEIELKRRERSILLRYRDDRAPSPGNSDQAVVNARNERVNVCNKIYSFEARREGDENDWIMSRLGTSDPSDHAALWRRIRASDAVAPFAHYAFGEGSNLLDLIRRDDFRLTNIANAMRNGVQEVVVEFTLSSPLHPMLKLNRGKVYCDPNYHFAVRRTEGVFTITGHDRNPVLGSREIERDDQGRVVSLFTTNDLNVSTFAVVQWLDAGQVRDNDFRLSAFGLPEVGPNSRVRWQGLLVLLTVLAVVSFVTGVVLWNRAG